MTRYAIENNAITLVYFNESRRRRKESGIMISLYSSAFVLFSFRSLAVHERCDPELAIHEKTDISGTWGESNHDPRHQIPNDDQIADSHAKALDRNRRIEQDRQVRICKLG